MPIHARGLRGGGCFIVQEVDEKLDRTIVTNHTWGIIMCGQLIAFNLIWQKSGVGWHIFGYLLTLFLWQLVVGRIWSKNILESNLQTSLLNIGVWVFSVTLTNVSSDQYVHIVSFKTIASRSPDQDLSRQSHWPSVALKQWQQGSISL